MGDSKQVTVPPELGYGPVNPQAFVEVDRAHLPKDAEPKVGMGLRGRRQDGSMFMGRVHEVKDSGIVLDLNHPLAGKTLVFQVTVTSIEAAPAPSAPAGAPQPVVPAQ